MSSEPLRIAGRPLSVRTLELDRRTPAQVIADRAHAAGVELGARVRSEAERESATRALERAAERLDAFRQEADASLARTATELALAITRRLLRSELSRGNVDLERVVRETLQAASSERGACVVHLNPADLEALAGVEFRAGTRLCADVEVARGDVHVETSLGLIVRELDGALESIAGELRELLP